MSYIDIVFSGEDPNLVFVEIEDCAGKSVRRGEWVTRPDGYRVLRMTDPERLQEDFDRLLHGSSATPP